MWYRIHCRNSCLGYSGLPPSVRFLDSQRCADPRRTRRPRRTPGGSSLETAGESFPFQPKFQHKWLIYNQLAAKYFFCFRKRRKFHLRRLTFGKLVSNKVSMAVTKQQVTGERNCGWRSLDVHLKAENMVISCHYFFQDFMYRRRLIFNIACQLNILLSE